jgi:hypothetical protein
MTNTELSDLLSDCLSLWGVTGQTFVGKEAVRLVTEAGYDIAIHHHITPGNGWSVEILKWPAGDPAPARPIRTCASIVSLLRAIRALVGANQTGIRLRFMPAALPAREGPLR